MQARGGLRERYTPIRSAATLAAVLLTLLQVIGCGSTGPAPTALARDPSPPIQRPASPSTVAARARFRTLVGEVCQAVRGGSPTALAPPFSVRRLTGYANGARPVARRTVVSLRRLSQQGALPGLPALVHAFSQLETTYASVPAQLQASHDARQVGQALELNESAVSTAALHAGLPACMVAGTR